MKSPWFSSENGRMQSILCKSKIANTDDEAEIRPQFIHVTLHFNLWSDGRL